MHLISPVATVGLTQGKAMLGCTVWPGLIKPPASHFLEKLESKGEREGERERRGGREQGRKEGSRGGGRGGREREGGRKGEVGRERERKK